MAALSGTHAACIILMTIQAPAAAFVWCVVVASCAQVLSCFVTGAFHYFLPLGTCPEAAFAGAPAGRGQVEYAGGQICTWV
jgi:hypothetical protein